MTRNFGNLLYEQTHTGEKTYHCKECNKNLRGCHKNDETCKVRYWYCGIGIEYWVLRFFQVLVLVLVLRFAKSEVLVLVLLK